MLKRLVVYVFKVFVILLTLVGWMAAGITTINFMVAVTPEGTSKKPAVAFWMDNRGLDHGSYYHWWTIQERPFLFGISIFYLFACIFFFWDASFGFDDFLRAEADLLQKFRLVRITQAYFRIKSDQLPIPGWDSQRDRFDLLFFQF